MLKHWMAAVLIVSCLGAHVAQAQDGDREDRKRAAINPEVLTEGFLAAHPDLRWRGEAFSEYEKGNYQVALTYLERAARYADKPSQAVIAEMYWKGVGVPVDKPLAYVWMDIAAERLYHDFVVYRERYWRDLTEAERSEALERGQAILAEYGDDVAKPRLEKILRAERRKITGSRVGSVGNLTIIPFTGPLAGSGMQVRGNEYYDEKYWRPAAYWRLQDQIWRAPLRGRVDVGDVQNVPDEEANNHEN